MKKSPMEGKSSEKDEDSALKERIFVALFSGQHGGSTRIPKENFTLRQSRIGQTLLGCCFHLL